MPKRILQGTVVSDKQDKTVVVKVETQTRVLSEAVIAITDTSKAVAPAIRAVKAEM